MSDATAHAAHGGHDDHGHEHDDGAVHAHISSFGFLCSIFALLIFLTFVTVAVSYVDLGSANTVVAVLIATMKASVVALFFMHLRHDKLFHGVVFVSSFVFLGIFLILTADDLTTRGRVDPANGVDILSRTGAIAPGLMESPRLVPEPPPGERPGEGEHGGGHAAGAEHNTAGEHANPGPPAGEHGGAAAGQGSAEHH